MAISPQRLTIYLYSAYRAVIFAIAQLSCYIVRIVLVELKSVGRSPIYTYADVAMGTLSVNEIQSVNHLLSHTQHAQLVIFRVLKSTSPARQQQQHVRQRNVFCYCDLHTIYTGAIGLMQRSSSNF